MLMNIRVNYTSNRVSVRRDAAHGSLKEWKEIARFDGPVLYVPRTCCDCYFIIKISLLVFVLRNCPPVALFIQ